jgi:threonylcarbamoyladenosine tRNA methylthiotransferase MtaB
MARRYKKELYAERVARIRTQMPHACIGVDVIVGFPGETQEEFNETVDFLESLEVSYFHVFTYSERDNTPAATMPGVVPVHERRRRNAILTELSAKKRRDFDMKHQGATRPVLWEADKNPALMAGWSDNYVRVSAPRREEMIGFLEEVVLAQDEKSQLIATA